MHNRAFFSGWELLEAVIFDAMPANGISSSTAIKRRTTLPDFVVTTPSLHDDHHKHPWVVWVNHFFLGDFFPASSSLSHYLNFSCLLWGITVFLSRVNYNVRSFRGRGLKDLTWPLMCFMMWFLFQFWPLFTFWNHVSWTPYFWANTKMQIQQLSKSRPKYGSS